MMAHGHGLSATEFQHLFRTFPMVAKDRKTAGLQAHQNPKRPPIPETVFLALDNEEPQN